VRPTSPFADQDVYVRIPHGTGRLFRILAVVFGRPATTSFLWVISTENPGQFTQVGSGREQRSEKPLLIEFDPRAGESRFASSRLPRPPGVFRGLAIHWQHAVGVVDCSEPNLNSILVPATGFEPATFGLKARPHLRSTPPDVSPRIGFSARRLRAAPPISPAWLYKLAIHQRALSDRPARAPPKRRCPLPTPLRRPTASREVRGSSPRQPTIQTDGSQRDRMRAVQQCCAAAGHRPLCPGLLLSFEWRPQCQRTQPGALIDRSEPAMLVTHAADGFEPT
jgi:hypothetical protein